MADNALACSKLLQVRQAVTFVQPRRSGESFERQVAAQATVHMTAAPHGLLPLEKSTPPQGLPGVLSARLLTCHCEAPLGF